MTIVDFAKEFLDTQAIECNGNDDPTPFLILTDHNGENVLVAMEMPGDQDKKDELADTFIALCIMHRASEVVFCSLIWMAAMKPGDTYQAPSKSPNRVERAMLFHVTASGEATVHFAPVVREADSVIISGWKVDSSAIGEGRFSDALVLGMRLANSIPPDIAALMDHLAVQDMNAMLNPLVAMIRESRIVAKLPRN